MIARPRLHNLKNDIGETKDLTAANPDKVKTLKSAYDAWNKDNPEPGWLPQPQKQKKKN